MFKAALLIIFFALAPFRYQSKRNQFDDGCCVNFPNPKKAVRKEIQVATLLATLNCAANNRFIGTSKSLARELGTGDHLDISYFYGRYLPRQEGDTLSMGVYSQNGSTGYLFDADVNDDGAIVVVNIPPVLKSKTHWRVGEIDGGLWSYTRLYYIAQDIGDLPRTLVSVDRILSHKPSACWVMVEEQWDNRPKKHPK